jgi:hypothetical protein
MQYKTYLLKLHPGQANEVYAWCRNQLGEEFINWKYIYGGGSCYVSTGEIDQTFIIKGIENIVLFELAWSELKSQRDPFQ